MRDVKAATCCVLIIVLALTLPLVAGCKQEVTVDRIPDLLREKLGEIKSYQMTMCIARTGADQHEVKQWYKAPHGLRTDVLQAGEPIYSFLLRDGSLLCKSYLEGLTTELAAKDDTALFLEPLLLSLWQEVLTASLTENEQVGTFIAELQWQGLHGRSHASRLSLDAKSLMPIELHLFVEEEHLGLTIQFRDIVLDPDLDDELFAR